MSAHAAVNLASERVNVLNDLASVQAGVRDVELLLAKRAIALHRADDIFEQCARDLKALADRLRWIDASLVCGALHNT